MKKNRNFILSFIYRATMALLRRSPSIHYALLTKLRTKKEELNHWQATQKKFSLPETNLHHALSDAIDKHFIATNKYIDNEKLIQQINLTLK